MDYRPQDRQLGYDTSHSYQDNQNNNQRGNGMAGWESFAAAGAQDMSRMGWDYFVRYPMESSNNREAMLVQQWNEDRKYQRAVSDLRGAGLSPTLAVGSQAKSADPIVTPAPRGSFSPLEAMLAQANVDTQATQRANQTLVTNAQVALSNAQREALTAMVPYQQAEMFARARQALSAAGLSGAQMQRELYDLLMSREAGTTTHPGITGSVFRDINTFIDRMFGTTPEGNINPSPGQNQQHGAQGHW